MGWGAILLGSLVSAYAHAAIKMTTGAVQAGVGPDGSIRLTPHGASTALEVRREAIGLRWKGRWLHPGAGLKLEAISTLPLHGVDNLGPYLLTEVTWRSNEEGTSPIRFQTNVRVYEHEPAVALEQVFLDGTEKAAVEDQDEDKVTSSFPAFSTKAGFFADKAFLSYAYNMACPEGVLFCTQTGTLVDGGQHLADIDGQQGGVPLVLFDESMSCTLVISPMDNFMSTNVYFRNDSYTLQYGVQGRVDTVPVGFRMTTILYWAEGGVNHALERWGAAMRRFYQVHHGLEDDFTSRYLSYYTDNGAYYYYLTEDGKTYEDTLLDVWAHAKEQRIPYRSLQLDSWWYFKGRDNGVTAWEPRPEVFPNGLEYLSQKLQVPFIAHNRWWSVETGYAKQNGGDYEFHIEYGKELPPPPPGMVHTSTSFRKGNKVVMQRQQAARPHRQLFGDDFVPLPYGAAVPLEERFWDDLFTTARSWGLYTYEQDWLHNEFLTLNSTMGTVDRARTWLLQMGRAADKAGIRIQYCMAFPRFYLQTLEIPAVTQIRVSDDYGPSTRPDQWSLGDTSLLAYSLGLAPFKDVFWSTGEQPGNTYNHSIEAKPNLEAAISTLSAGPVGPGDKIGLMDRELIMRSCNDDGLLLKPSRPITSIDSTFLQRTYGRGGPVGAVLTTFSRIGTLRFDIILAAALNETYHLRPRDLAPSDGEVRAGGGALGIVAYTHSFESKKVTTNVTAKPFGGAGDPQQTGIALGPCGRKDFQLWYTSPVLPGGIVLLGELSKWVPISAQRVLSIESIQETGEVHVQIQGAVGETVALSFTTVSDLAAEPVVATCQLSESGVATVRVETRGTGSASNATTLSATCT